MCCHPTSIFYGAWFFVFYHSTFPFLDVHSLSTHTHLLRRWKRKVSVWIVCMLSMFARGSWGDV